MKRVLSQLAENKYDLLVIGGGIYGACIAWDAALRGLAVALIERSEFGGATSANSLGILHGGLRYLPDANFGLVRRMIRERRAFLRIAPHLVHPLPCVIPCYRHMGQERTILRVALALNDLFGLDRNDGVISKRQLPGSRLISREQYLQFAPGAADERQLTGGAIWYDARIDNPERLTFAFLHSANSMGAHLANHVEAVGFLGDEHRVTGIRARDALTDTRFDIRASIVVNATGPWVDNVLNFLNSHRQGRHFYPSIAMNLVTDQILPSHAVGLPSLVQVSREDGRQSRRIRYLFIVPGQGCSVIGTSHLPCDSHDGSYTIKEEDVHRFIQEINNAYPAAALTLNDIKHIQHGLLPAHRSDTNDVYLVREGRIYDHAKAGAVEGLITIVGVKYTTARYTAEKAVDLSFQKLGYDAPPSLTAMMPLCGGNISDFDDFLDKAMRERPYWMSKETMDSIVHNYGTEYRRILSCLPADLVDEQDPEDAVTLARNSYAVREEMAQCGFDIACLRPMRLPVSNFDNECFQPTSNTHSYGA